MTGRVDMGSTEAPVRIGMVRGEIHPAHTASEEELRKLEALFAATSAQLHGVGAMEAAAAGGGEGARCTIGAVELGSVLVWRLGTSSVRFRAMGHRSRKQG